MNCEQLKEDVFEYLDGTLSPSEMEAARRHVEACAECRERVECERVFERSMTERFQKTVEELYIEEHLRRRICAHAESKIAGPSRERFSAWKRHVFPLAAAGALGVVLLWVTQHRAVPPGPPRGTAQVFSESQNRNVSVEVMYCVPNYTFHRDGDTVVDALTCDPQRTEADLIVNN